MDRWLQLRDYSFSMSTGWYLDSFRQLRHQPGTRGCRNCQCLSGRFLTLLPAVKVTINIVKWASYGGERGGAGF